MLLKFALMAHSDRECELRHHPWELRPSGIPLLPFGRLAPHDYQADHPKFVIPRSPAIVMTRSVLARMQDFYIGP